ncbi:MAG: aminotransferase class V-fold PLP-dependent enzyme [Ignavibacteriales bacterium]|nr:aminotransferase class V-fold PLP-dependent enzyme [Ignavibacteriales bacterium]
MKEYQKHQHELEMQPVEFIGRRSGELLSSARAQLASYLGCLRDDLVFIPNTTTGVNAIARSIRLKHGDQVLISDQEYGALERMWRIICEETGAELVIAKIPYPIENSDQIKNALLNAVTPKTKPSFFSHITSASAITFPAKEIIDELRGKNIYTIIDAAHAPGQIPVNITELDPDFYTGNCHKWMMAPKGSAFLYVKNELQYLMKPPVISWGLTNDVEGPSHLINEFEYQGTHDISNYLTVPAAIQFMEDYHWTGISEKCHHLALETKILMEEVKGMEVICATDPSLFKQMAAIKLPVSAPADLKEQLYEKFKIEIPVFPHNGARHIRVSVQGYNTKNDLDILIEALHYFLD